MGRILAIAIIFCLLAATAFAFTDADLKKYETGGEKIVREPESPAAGESTETAPPRNTEGSDPDHKNDPQYWCRRGRAANDRIEIARQQLKKSKMTAGATINVYGDRYVAAGAVANTLMNVNTAQKELQEAEKARDNLNDDAHRLDIPAGWLRCQFE
jgi:hypothetical protein